MKTMFRDRGRYRTNHLIGALSIATAFMRRHYLRLIDARALVAWFLHRTLCFVKTTSYGSRGGGAQGHRRRRRSPRSIFRCSGTEDRHAGIFAKAILQAVAVSHTQARTHARHAQCYFATATMMVIGSPRVTHLGQPDIALVLFSTDTYRASRSRRKKSGRRYFLQDSELTGKISRH